MFSVDVMRKNMNRAASSFDSAAVLYHEVADRLLERLDYIKIDPKSVLDVGSKTGRVLGELSKRYSGKCVYGYEPAAAMLNRIHGANPSLNAPLICGDYDLFPLQSEIVDVIFSNLSFHLSADIDKTIQECHRLLKPGGLLLFSTLGPDTLKELRQSFNQYDPLPHVHDFLDMHDIGDMLVKSRFSEPVMDMEYITMQ
jgi:malonyl-CoA O-methyltransferase